MHVLSLQLDGTMDLDERRLIRSALRELRRREIEDMEAALASKRFRPTCLNQQEDKENQHRSESNDNLDVLSQKLQSIQDVDELMEMLRAAAEYEERKMIRAAIRRIRDEQLQVSVERSKVSVCHSDPENAESQSIMGAVVSTELLMKQSGFNSELGHRWPVVEMNEYWVGVFFYTLCFGLGEDMQGLQLCPSSLVYTELGMWPKTTAAASGSRTPSTDITATDLFELFAIVSQKMVVQDTPQHVARNMR
ncbi:hypothetical protein AMECASPLE_020058 [Ameca splendens]|uniref:Smoothelin domain-containing protein n=1 Tax=Ameca splendens TaxID=208324 RepID=A0ABV0XS09_9TELE